jgi:hypothetical protein
MWDPQRLTTLWAPLWPVTGIALPYLYLYLHLIIIIIIIIIITTSSPSTIRMIKSKRMRWTGHVARMGRGRLHIEYWWESRKEGDYWEDQDVGGWTILKWILKR